LSDPYRTHKYVYGQNVEFFNVKPGGMYSDHWALESKFSLGKPNSLFCDNNTKRTDNCMEYAAYRIIKIGATYSS